MPKNIRILYIENLIDLLEEMVVEIYTPTWIPSESVNIPRKEKLYYLHTKGTLWTAHQNDNVTLDFAQCIEGACEMLERNSYNAAIIDIGLNPCGNQCKCVPTKAKRELESACNYSGIAIWDEVRKKRHNLGNIKKLFLTSYDPLTVEKFVTSADSKAEILQKSGTYADSAKSACSWLRKHNLIA